MRFKYPSYMPILKKTSFIKLIDAFLPLYTIIFSKIIEKKISYIQKKKRILQERESKKYIYNLNEYFNEQKKERSKEE